MSTQNPYGIDAQLQHVYAEIAITDEGKLTLFALGGLLPSDDLIEAQTEAMTSGLFNSEIRWKSDAPIEDKLMWVNKENNYRLAVVKIMNDFIESLTSAQANVAQACKKVNKSRNQMLTLRARVPHFDVLWNDTYEAVTDAIESAAIDRAINGVAKGVYYKGEHVADEVAYPEGTATFLLQGRRPDIYKQRSEHTINSGDSVDVGSLSDADLAAMISARRVKNEQQPS